MLHRMPGNKNRKVINISSIPSFLSNCSLKHRNFPRPQLHFASCFPFCAILYANCLKFAIITAASADGFCDIV